MPITLEQLKPGRVRVCVTQDDLDNGKPKDACECPLARAIRRALDLVDHVEVSGSDTISLEYLEAWSYSKDFSIEDFVNAFDSEERRSSLKPVDFELSINYREPEDDDDY